MASVSGLSADHRATARKRAVNAALLGHKNAPAIHYTQGAKRWEGIDQTDKASMGQFPSYADCSSFATWCLWNGLFLAFGCRDVVNGAGWKGGYTGTMLSHGKRVVHLSNVLGADCVIYGKPGSDGAHTAIVVAVAKGVPQVVSHGSEGGPYLVGFNYRPDVMCFRRYI